MPEWSFRTVKQALTIHKYMVMWAAGCWPDQEAVVKALRDEWHSEKAGLADAPGTVMVTHDSS